MSAAAERFHSFAVPPVLDEPSLPNESAGGRDVTNVTTTTTTGAFHFELEVTRRREREARDAIDKMDRAVSAMRDERDAARERSANDRAALAAASRRESDAVREEEEARKALAAMKTTLS